MSQATGNAFASAVRRVAGMAPAVRSGTVRAGAACAIALAILAAPGAYHQMPGAGPGIPGAAKVAKAASENASAARIQSQLSTYYACGLLKVTKQDLGQFGAAHGIASIRNVAAETLRDGATLPRPATSFRQAVANMADMGGTLVALGLSKVVDGVVGNLTTHSWVAGFQRDMDEMPAHFAEQSRAAGVERDLRAFEAAETEVDESIASIGCKI